MSERTEARTSDSAKSSSGSERGQPPFEPRLFVVQSKQAESSAAAERQDLHQTYLRQQRLAFSFGRLTRPSEASAVSNPVQPSLTLGPPVADRVVEQTAAPVESVLQAKLRDARSSACCTPTAAQLSYTQGQGVEVGPGQEQQMQERVKATPPAAPGGMVQRKIDKQGVIDEIRPTSSGPGVLAHLDDVQVHECSKMEYSENSKTEDLTKSTYGVTFPKSSPPLILLNAGALPSTEEAANTIYHETWHAIMKGLTMDIHINSKGAKEDDLVNEWVTMKMEAEFAVEKGGSYATDAVAYGIVKEDPPKSGKYVVDEEGIDKVVKGYEPGYLKQNRSKRLDPSNYTYTSAQDLSKADPKSWYSGT